MQVLVVDLYLVLKIINLILELFQSCILSLQFAYDSFATSATVIDCLQGEMDSIY